LGHNATFKLQLTDFLWAEKTSRIGGKILRFTFVWSISYGDCLFGQEEEGCIAFYDYKGNLQWHPAMTSVRKGISKHICLNTPDLQDHITIKLQNSSFGQELLKDYLSLDPKDYLYELRRKPVDKTVLDVV